MPGLTTKPLDALYVADVIVHSGHPASSATSQ